MELLNTVVIKKIEIYFRKDGAMYVINKQMTVDAFGVCQAGYVEDPKGQVNKLVVGELLYNHGIKPSYANANQYSGMERSPKCHLTLNTQL